MFSDSAKIRCGWCGGDELYRDYHDNEWGVPCYDELRLFEMLNLEGAQAGLSWITILRKRNTYREAFEGFQPQAIASWGEPEIRQLLNNPGIVRNKLKINATIQNARSYIDLQESGNSLSELLWSFTEGRVVQNMWVDISHIPASTEASERMSKELKKRGFKFVGPTICYALMQACGMVNDHVVSCYRFTELRGSG